jgi:hypothetical protein
LERTGLISRIYVAATYIQKVNAQYGDFECKTFAQNQKSIISNVVSSSGGIELQKIF